MLWRKRRGTRASTIRQQHFLPVEVIHLCPSWMVARAHHKTGPSTRQAPALNRKESYRERLSFQVEENAASKPPSLPETAEATSRTRLRLFSESKNGPALIS